jgi:hypothetical protein
MIRKSVQRFSEKIMRKHEQKARTCVKTRRRRRPFLIFGTRFEQTAPESVMVRCTHLFTARYRHSLQAVHNIQNEDNGPQPAADDKS